MAEDDKKNLVLLFQRPLEPIFTKKDNGKTVFDVPDDYYTDRYRPIGPMLTQRFGDDVDNRIPLRTVPLPDLKFTEKITKKGPFSLFHDVHKKIAAQLTKIFLDVPDIPSLLSTAAFVKDRINPMLYQYSLSVAMAHREDSKDISPPSIVQTFPDQFIDPSVFPKAREESALVTQESRMPVEIPLNFTASDRETEQRLAYFREDIGVNMHHWHWHLVYPGDGELAIVNKDRRGELFYYMHSQIIARYNVERIMANLGRVRPLSNLREPVIEGYFPKIIRSSNNRAYPPRVDNILLSDINRDADTQVQLADLERWRDRILGAIDQGFILSSTGQQIPLDEVTGIDTLGNIVESSALSPNPAYYGNLHNQGHNVISYSHDPEYRHLEDYGVMGDVTTAMRDPIFYRWHGFIDSVFAKFKNKLLEYNVDTQLAYNGIDVVSVGVQITKGKNPAPNVLLTYWQKSDVDLAAGLDFGAEGNIIAQFTHLQHAPFDYHITVNNNSGTPKRGTCRIFMGPRHDERGTPLQFRDQRSLMVEMDKFTVILNPGQNVIRQRSDQSSVTVPYERSFRRIGSAYQPTGAVELAQFQFCGCGWPQHMLLPRGTPNAQQPQFDIFVMISNYDDDNVNDGGDRTIGCNDASSFCGIKDKLYPDKRAMGFPFDRQVTSAATLSAFANLASNMAVGECTIRFTNAIIN